VSKEQIALVIEWYEATKNCSAPHDTTFLMQERDGRTGNEGDKEGQRKKMR